MYAPITLLTLVASLSGMSCLINRGPYYIQEHEVVDSIGGVKPGQDILPAGVINPPCPLHVSPMHLLPTKALSSQIQLLPKPALTSYVPVSAPTLAPMIIPVMPQMIPLPPLTFAEIPLPRPKPFKVPIIPKLSPVQYMEVELPVPAPLRIPVLPKHSPPKFVQIQLPKIAPVPLPVLPALKPIVLPKIQLPVIKHLPVVHVHRPLQIAPVCSTCVQAPMVQMQYAPCPCQACQSMYSPSYQPMYNPGHFNPPATRTYFNDHVPSTIHSYQTEGLNSRLPGYDGHTHPNYFQTGRLGDYNQLPSDSRHGDSTIIPNHFGIPSEIEQAKPTVANTTATPVTTPASSETTTDDLVVV